VSSPAPVNPRIGQLADMGVGVAGLVVAVVALALWVGSPSPLAASALAAAVLVVVMTQFPILLPQRDGDALIGLEASALVFLALVTSPGQALVLWCAGQAVAQGLSEQRLAARMFNFGVTSVAGAALVGIVAAGMGVGRDSPWLLAVTMAACAAYFLIDLVVTAVSLSLESVGRPRLELRWRSVPLPLVCFVGIDSLGYLAAQLQRHQPEWTLVLILVPVGTILAAVRAFGDARLAHQRLTQLFIATSGASDWGDVEQAEAMLVEQATQVLRSTRAELRDRPGSGHELSVRVEVEGREVRHLVVWHSGSAREKFHADDRRALETLVSVATEAISRRRLVDDMTHLAGHDPLTGLANRRVFTDRLDHALTLRGEGTRLAILYCDLDGFKAVNDRLGHEVGDALLAAVAERVVGCLRPGDTAARLGGDEFALLLEQVHRGGAEAVAERVLAALADPFEAARGVEVSASIGIAYVGSEQRAVDVMRHADTAMYRAKALGKNRAELFVPSMQAENLRQLRLADELRAAVRDQAFTVAYQSVVDLGTGELEGYEALARWTHPTLGAIPPDVFIPLAERLGLIGDLGLQVLDIACEGAAVLQRGLGRPMTMAVNVSPLQVADPELLDRVRGAVARYPDVGLVLELTEMARLADDAATARALEAFVAAGASLAVDDFGTGWSSISYLNRLPLATLKVDRSFTRELASPRTLTLVEAVVAMARAMGLRVVAEGVEDAAAQATLRRLGCHSGQGFHFSRPEPLEVALLGLDTHPVADNVRRLHGH
jgi:diguanylate cyclase (GGDEF)-like protein